MAAAIGQIRWQWCAAAVDLCAAMLLLSLCTVDLTRLASCRRRCLRCARRASRTCRARYAASQPRRSTRVLAPVPTALRTTRAAQERRSPKRRKLAIAPCPPCDVRTAFKLRGQDSVFARRAYPKRFSNESSQVASFGSGYTLGALYYMLAQQQLVVPGDCDTTTASC
eukprot:6179271-Pleurochrysis_carterae.AAC.2